MPIPVKSEPGSVLTTGNSVQSMWVSVSVISSCGIGSNVSERELTDGVVVGVELMTFCVIVGVGVGVGVDVGVDVAVGVYGSDFGVEVTSCTVGSFSIRPDMVSVNCMEDLMISKTGVYSSRKSGFAEKVNMVIFDCEFTMNTNSR